MQMRLTVTTDTHTHSGQGSLERGMSALERLLTGEAVLFPADERGAGDEDTQAGDAQTAYATLLERLS